MKRLGAICLSLILMQGVPLYGQDLLDGRTRDLLHEALSGEAAKDHVIQITRHHRIQGSRGYRHAAEYVLNQLRNGGYGAADSFMESFPSDGKVSYQTWQSPSGWDIEWGELRMVEPVQERIVGYPEIGMSVMTYSNPGEVTAELVWVGTGTSDADYDGKEVSGKIVLATGYGGEVHRQAVLKHGAQAVVCYLDDERAKLYPDMLQYTGMWPKSEELPRVTFGFNIPNRQGERLRALLERGTKVVLDGRVKGIGLEPYFMDVVVALIPGADPSEKEILLTAHLDHPKESANDNASGSAGMLDMALTLKRLIAEGKLPQPKRSIRFLWVPEWNGTMAYIDAHPELCGPQLGGGVLANINLDMIGENLELLHSRMIITRTPHSVPSALNDVIENMAAMVDRMDIRTPRGSQSLMNYRIEPYSGGSDHMMAIDRKIPGVMIVHDDYTHHTSEDTPDKVDPVELERSEILASGAALILANLTLEQGLHLSALAGANASGRLGDVCRMQQQRIMAADAGDVAGVWAEAQNALDHHRTVELETLRSILTFNDASELRDHVALQEQVLTAQYAHLTQAIRFVARTRGESAQSPPPLPGTSDRRVPERLTRGPLDFGLPTSALSEEDRRYYTSGSFTLSGDETFELVNFIDGRRSVTDIRDALSAEFRPIETSQVAHYLEDLVKAGVIRWR
jgi:aminopeptidase YwaD